MRKALITGIYGQDGSFLCEQLMKDGYEVHGIAKPILSNNSAEIKAELDDNGITPCIHYTDLYNHEELNELIAELKPDEVYHVAASHVSAEGKGDVSCATEQVLYNKNVTATGNLLEACLMSYPKTRIITAGSCLMYDGSATNTQDVATPFESRSLYGLAKIAEKNLVDYYRKQGLFACTAILYNHESHRRGIQFVTRKIVANMVKIKMGIIEEVSLGNIETEKDWGYAGDYTDAMIRMVRASNPKDYIVATGETHSVRELIETCSQILELGNWESFIRIGETEINRKIEGRLCGDASVVEKELSWTKTKGFQDIIREMIEFEQKRWTD